LNKYIKAHNLDYRILLGLAKKYYNKKVIMKIAELAIQEEE